MKARANGSHGDLAATLAVSNKTILTCQKTVEIFDLKFKIRKESKKDFISELWENSIRLFH